MGSRPRALLAIAAGVTALTLVTAGCSGGGSKPKGAGSGPSTADAAASAQDVANKFLAAWAAGDYKTAAALTDDPAKAEPRLASVMKSLAPKSISLALGSGTPVPAGGATTGTGAPTAGGKPGGTATATATAPATAGSTSSAPARAATRFQFSVDDDFGDDLHWKYGSALSVYDASGSTPPQVHWSSAVINPQLGGQANLKALPPAVPVTDNKGVLLTGANHPSLAKILGQLSTARPSNSGIAPSLQITFVDANTGNPLSGATPIQLGVAGATNGIQLASTFDDKIQTAAENAVKMFPESGMVVIQPSTGNVLAIATNSTTVSGLAYHATRAPGSTFKTISAAALLQAGVKPTDDAPCTSTATVGTQTYHNDEGLANGLPGANLLEAYEQSCNTSFVNLRGKVSGGLSALSTEAKDYFGMNQPWDMGVGSATYCTTGSQQVPPADGDERLGAEMFGQGNITMCPLTMATVAATVATGQFHQPVFIPGQKPIATAQPLPGDVKANLQMMMRGVVNNGTALSLKGISPNLGAKTGSAEPNNKDVTDSWMIAMDPTKDIAVCALVLNGGFGNAKAGPEIAAMLKAAVY